MVDYVALKNQWMLLTGTIADKLAAINTTVVGKDSDGNDIYWPFANGWRAASPDFDSPNARAQINENDLVPAGCITEQERQDHDKTLNGHRSPEDGSVRKLLLENALAGDHKPLVNYIDAATANFDDAPIPMTVLKVGK